MKTIDLKIITLIALVFLGGYLLYQKEREVPLSADSSQVKQLKMENMALSKKNKMLDQQIRLLEMQQDSLTQAIINKGKSLQHLKQIRDEKISTIEHYSNDKLFLFFARINTDSTGVE